MIDAASRWGIMRSPIVFVLCGAFCLGAVTGCASLGAPADSPELASAYLCGGTKVSAGALATRTPVGALSGRPEEALTRATFDDGSPLQLDDVGEWFVVAQSDDEVTLVREIERESRADTFALPADHEKITVSWIDATNLDPGWYVSASGTCALTVDLGELTVPLVSFDPEWPADPDSRDLHLLVTEQTCNSGADATGRIEVVRIDETEARIDLLLGVRPRGGDQNCPSNPATPFTVQLADPLGARVVVNGALEQQRDLNGR